MRALSDVARIKAFELETIALVADEVIKIPEGWVARTARLSLVWDFNHVGVSRPIELGAALALVESHLDGLPHRHLVVEDEATGERLEPKLRAEGWKADRNVIMALRDEPDRGLDTSCVIDAGEEEALELMRRWLGEDEEIRQSAEEWRQVVEASRLTWRARHARRLGVRGRNGQLAGITVLFSDGAVAQLEDVYVVPEERGRGVARALVTQAAVLAQDAGHELTFIVGDDNDWPKELYAKVGFEAVARTWGYTVRRRPAGGPAPGPPRPAPAQL